LVTGGAGFIGSHLVERLLGEGEHVVVIDNFDDYYDPELKRANVSPFAGEPDFRLVEGDIRDGELVRDTIREEGIEHIYHLAAQAGVDASVKDPTKTFEVNVGGTLNLLLAARDEGVRKLVNASSSSVFGRNAYLPLDEAHPTQPISPYGVSKLAVEHYCRVFSELYGLRTTSLRYFTVYGPRMRPDLALSIFTRLALKGEPLTIYGDGTKTRDFTYVEDIVDATVRASKGGDGGTFNIGFGKRHSIKEAAEKIIELTGSGSTIRYEGDRIGDAQHTWTKNEAALGAMGWRPTTSLVKGLEKYVDHVKSLGEG
jgi:UDP-glucose 4-epimerase